MNFSCVSWSKAHEKNKTQDSNAGATSRAPQTSRSTAQKGIKIMRIVEMTGRSYPPGLATINLFEVGGWNAIRPAVRGRSPSDRVLSPAQEEAIQRMTMTRGQSNSRLNFTCGAELREPMFEQELAQSYRLEVPASTAPAGASLAKSLSSAPMGNARPQYEFGSRASIPASSSAPELRERKIIGVMRRRWSTPMCAAEATRRQAKHR